MGFGVVPRVFRCVLLSAAYLYGSNFQVSRLLDLTSAHLDLLFSALLTLAQVVDTIHSQWNSCVEVVV